MLQKIVLQELTFEDLINGILDVFNKQTTKKEVVHKNDLKLFTREETAKLFSVSLPTINNWTKKGVINAITVGNRVYYSKTEIDRVINKN